MRATSKLAAVSVALLVVAAPGLAAADSQADLAVAIGERTSRTQQRIVEKLMTFKLGDACWTKLLERGNTGAALIASAAHDGGVTGALEAYLPTSGQAFVPIQVKAKAKGVETEVDKSGTRFAITGARDVETSGWPASIDGPIKRVSVGPTK